MVFGMTMIKVKPSQDSIAYQTIQSIKGVKEIYRIFGEYNFFLIWTLTGVGIWTKLLMRFARQGM